MQFQRLVADHSLNRRKQRARAIRREQSAGIFDIEGIDVGAGGELASTLDVVSIVVNRTQREYKRHDDVFAPTTLHHGRASDVRVRIVHRICQTKTADAVADENPKRQRHEIRTGGLPGDEPKSRRHELQRRIRHCSGHQPDSFPGILLLVANRHTHVCGRREIDGFEADPIHGGCDAQRPGRIDTESRPQALISISKRGLDDANFSHFCASR
ncbi:MAG TPA: hypothetical protein VGD63_00055 [Steroidobacteraceae bacterium]